MVMIKPFKGLRARADNIVDMISPPYDVVDRQQAKLIAQDKDYDFLHLTKPEIDLSDDIDELDSKVSEQAKLNLQKFIQDKILVEDEVKGFYVYRMQMNQKIQTGLVAAVAIEDYQQGLIHQHEYTKPAKVKSRVELMKAQQASLSPVLLTYRDDTNVDIILDKVVKTTPLYNNIELNHVKYSLWKIEDKDTITLLQNEFSRLALYVADGHHRTEAADLYSVDNTKIDSFLAVCVPDKQVSIMGYHRLIRVQFGVQIKEVVQQLQLNFDMIRQPSAVIPTRRHQIGCYCQKQWYSFDVSEFTSDDLVNDLDVSILHRQIIEPLFLITDVQRDTRIDFVGGVDSVHQIEARVDGHEMDIAFTLYPPSIEQIMNIADNHEMMPPKSTWFEPKLADGMISYLYNKHG